MSAGIKYKDGSGNYQPVGRGPKGPKGDKGDTGPAGASPWGYITGDIDSQLDLKSKLDSRVEGVNTRRITVSETAPATPQEGDIWINPSETPAPYTPPAGSITPSMRSGGMKVGTIPKETFSSTGAKTVSGLGFKPKLVKFTLIPDPPGATLHTGSGAMDEFGNQWAVSQSYSPTATPQGTIAARSSSRCIIRNSGSSVGAVSLSAEFVSMNPDGFTINVIDASAGSIQGFAWEAYA